MLGFPVEDVFSYEYKCAEMHSVQSQTIPLINSYKLADHPVSEDLFRNQSNQQTFAENTPVSTVRTQ